MYLKAATFEKEIRCFKQGDSFDFQEITILVGDQGTGKSTLLDHLFKSKSKSDLKLDLTDAGKKGVESFYFDTEKMNPRLKNPLEYTNIDGTNKGIGLHAAVKTRYSSHGEVMKLFTIDGLKKANNCILFLDEPESGLSIRNQYKLTKEIHETQKRNCQLIIATHCLPIIQSVDQVLSMEHRKWMTSQEFIESQI